MHIATTSDPTLPPVPSPFEGKKLKFLDHLKISAYWFGSNVVWGALLGPVLPKQMEILDPSNTSASLGMLLSFGAAAALIIPLLFGPLSDRCQHPWGRRRPYILAGGVIGLIGLLLMLMASKMVSLPLFFLGFLTLQIGSNTALAAYSGVIPDLVPSDQRGTASSFMAVMSSVGSLIGAVVGATLISKSEGALYCYILLFAIFALFIYLSCAGLKENPLVGFVPKFEPIAYLKSLWIDPRKYPDFAWVWITRAMMMMGFYAILPNIVFYLRDVIKLPHPEKDSIPVFFTVLVCMCISASFGGPISDKIGRKPVVYFASLLIASMSIAFIFCNTLIAVLLVGLVFGAGYGCYTSVDWALGTDALPRKEDAGKDMAVWHVSMTLPQSMAPLVAGLALNAFKLPGNATPVHYQPMGYSVVFVGAAVLFTLGAIWLRNVKNAK